MQKSYQQINRTMLIGWLFTVAALLVFYTGEVMKGERSSAYMIFFVPVVTIPWLVNFLLYRKDPGWTYLCYPIVVGYFLMYLFVMFTDSSSMVFSFILPLLAFLILYHHPRLILGTGVASLIVNITSLFRKYQTGGIDVSNSKKVEIQVAIIVLCFGGCYLAAKLYDDMAKQSHEYLKKINETNEELERMSLQTIATIAKMLDAKDSYTEGHSQRVSAYAAQMARELGMSEEDAERIRKIALLHDIGKVGISDLVLNKPGRLTDEEFTAMRQHSAIGSEIIRHVKTLPGLYDGVRYHHERYDGKGYPDGLKGDEIPYIARLIAVCDAYDAMTSNRVYRKHLTVEQVMSELEKGVGTQFDPIIASKMIQLLNEGRFENLSPDMVEEAG